MKKGIFRFIAVAIAAIIMVCQLQIGFMVLADDKPEAPKEYPEMTVLKLDCNMQYFSDNPETEKTKTSFKSEVDFTEESYDYFELDFCVLNCDTAETIKLSVYDISDNISTHSFSVESGIWSHLRFKSSDFEGSADLTAVLGYRIEEPKAGIEYSTANLCFTGVMQPENQTRGDVIDLSHRIDFTDTSKSSARSEIFAFDALPEVDIYSKDWIEFDLFIVGTDGGSVTPGITLVDCDYTLSSKTDNQSYYKISLDVGKWQHFKISVRDFKTYNKKNCNFNRIVGVCISSTKDNTRYVLANLSLTTTKVTPPEIVGEKTILKSGIFTEYYSLSDNSKSDVSVLDTMADFSSEYHMSLDIFIDSAFSDIKKISIILTDIDNNISTYDINALAGGWINIKIPIYALENDSIKLDSINGIYLSNLSEYTRYFAANLCLSDFSADIKYSYPENALKIEGSEIDYIKKASDDAKASQVNFNEINIEGYDQLQFDMIVDTPLDSSVLPEELKLVLVDKYTNEYTLSFKYTNNMLVDDLKVNLSAVSGIDKTGVCGIYIKNASNFYRYIVKNICFLKITPPELSENVDLESILQPNPIVKHQDFTVAKTYNAPIKFDNNAVVDITKADYVELDVYIVMNESREDYTDKNIFTLYLCDDTYVAKNYGRVAAIKLEAKSNGWTHLKIPVSSFSTANGWNGNKKALISFMVEAQNNGLHYVVANMCVTINKAFRDYNGVYPNNVTDFRIDEASDWNVSTGFWNSYTKLEPTVNVKDTDYIKFDIFCFSKENTTDRIQFSFGNCDKGEWGRRAFALVTVKTNQWVTVKIKIADLNTLTLGLNLDLTKASMYSVDSADRTSERVVIRKLCTVKRISDVEKDTETKPSRPDKDSRYISDCEAITTDIGVWTSSTSYFTTDYKTEGEKSVATKIENTDNATLNSLRFLFYSLADFSAVQTVKFDLFIDDKKLANNCDFNVVFSGDRRALSKNYSYKIKESLNNGWNTIEIPMSSFVADSEADLKTIQSFVINVTIRGFADDDYFVVGLDNLRVNKSFSMATETTDNTNSFEKEEESEQFDSMIKPSHTNIYEKAEIIKLEPEENTTYTTKQIIKKQKVILDEIAISHWIIMLVTLCVSAVLIAGSMIILIKNRSSKKNGG